MLQVITKTTDPDLTSTSRLRSIIYGATATSTVYDPHLSLLIRAGSRWAESYLGYPLSRQTYRETLPGYGKRNLMVARTPLVGVDALYAATDTGDATSLTSTEYRIENDEAGLISRDEGFAWTATLQWRASARNAYGQGGDAIPLNPEPLSGQEYRPWLVDYKAGWTYNGVSTGSDNWTTAGGTTSTERTLPEDIEMGVLIWCQMTHINPAGITSESLGDASVTYNARTNGDDSPPECLLAPYRRMK